jgi:hypothetical protein
MLGNREYVRWLDSAREISRDAMDGVYCCAEVGLLK